MLGADNDVDLVALLEQGAEEIAADWMAVLRRDPTCRPTELVDELQSRAASLLLSLSDALAQGPVTLAADHFRSVVREFSFLGGWLASRSACPSLVVRLTGALGEALAAGPVPGLLGDPSWRALEQGLAAVVSETYFGSVRATERAAVEEVLERCTPVVRLPGDVPAVLVVGSPSRQTLSLLFGRVLLEVARFGSDMLLLDFTNALELDTERLQLVAELVDHRKLQSRRVVVSGLGAAELRLVRSWLQGRDNAMFVETWNEALTKV